MTELRVKQNIMLVCVIILLATGSAFAGNSSLQATNFLLLLKKKTDTSCENYGTVVSSTGRVWMDRNLGACRVATSLTDTEAYGDLYQWGRGTDGHEKRTSLTTTTLSTSDDPGHDYFIISYPYDWRSPKNDNLWQGVSGINNPCPAGFRLPTSEEWTTEMNSWENKTAAAAFGSPLRLVVAGHRRDFDATIVDDDRGHYWSSSLINNELYIYTSMAGIGGNGRASGYSVRCIKD